MIELQRSWYVHTCPRTAIRRLGWRSRPKAPQGCFWGTYSARKAYRADICTFRGWISGVKKSSKIVETRKAKRRKLKEEKDSFWSVTLNRFTLICLYNWHNDPTIKWMQYRCSAFREVTDANVRKDKYFNLSIAACHMVNKKERHTVWISWNVRVEMN